MISPLNAEAVTEHGAKEGRLSRKAGVSVQKGGRGACFAPATAKMMPSREARHLTH
jgi:hypothetical protein